jgi:GIY-YIG catalytic domain
MAVANRQLVGIALARLAGPCVSVGEVDAEESAKPGLYALYGSLPTWRELGLGVCPDSRPLYVGKAENTLDARDLRGHFGMRRRGVQSPTGSSTVRRSLAALLASTRGYSGIPRNSDRPGHFSNFGLSIKDDDDLSAWMRRRLRLAIWPHLDAAALNGIETEVLKKMLLPLNLNKVVTPWQTQVKSARKLLAQQAREWKSPAR